MWRRRLKTYRPRSLLLQWHITDRCNLRCKHCYQETYSGDELSFNELLYILEQYEEFLRQFRPAIRGHITITGGEPFMRPDFPALSDIFASHRKQFSFAILSNGTLIDAEMAHWLKTLNVSFVQLSIEGTRQTHDAIRGQGNYDKSISAINYLVSAGIRTLISFTAHRGNFKEFSDVANLGIQSGVSRVWADRLIPQGNNSLQILTPDETREFFTIMNNARAEARKSSYTEIAMNRALQFLIAGGRPYHCSAADTLITIMPNGDLYPCRRMPILAGNVLRTPLKKLYDCDLFQELRERKRISQGCEGCFYERICRGGLKCLSYAVTGSPFKADPGCWYAAPRLSHGAEDVNVSSFSLS